MQKYYERDIRAKDEGERDIKSERRDKKKMQSERCKVNNILNEITDEERER